MDDKVLRQLQLTMLETLKVFDAFCRKHDIKYSLYAGSLLGAVRHKGFIPWDDDLDVCMSRAEYDRFVALWEAERPDGYILQNKENTPAYWQSFSKIRKDHTAFVMYESEMGRFHTGIFLDIFPIDRIPNGSLKRKLFKWHCMVYQLMVKGFAPPLSSAPVRLGSNVILALIPVSRRNAVRQKMLRKITRYNNRKELETVGIETMGSIRKPFAPDMLDEYVYLTFEDGEFMCFAGWEDHLRRKFGDYMQLPPEEDRAWRHHPIVLDFTHSYEELVRK